MPLFPRAFQPATASVDLTEFDLVPAIGLVRDAAGRMTGLAKDVTYTAIGLGILGFQEVQTRRRQIDRAMGR